MFSPKIPERPFAVLALASLLALVSFTSSAQVPSPAPAGRACEWSEPGGNTAYPETHARYFRLPIPRSRTEGLRLRIDGDYLATRYFSYQLYGSAFNAIDVLADHQIQPDPGSQSPLAGITRIDGAVIGDASRYDDEWYAPTWTADVRFTEGGPISALLVNDSRESNTTSSNDPAVGAAAVLTGALRDLGVTVTGSPAPTYLWKKNGPTISGASATRCADRSSRRSASAC